MKLYILRHGDAVEHGDPRFVEDERPLTAKGIRETTRLAKTLRDREISFDALLSSPHTRARQTAEIVANRVEEEVRFSDHLKPEGDMEKLIAQIKKIRPAPKTVLLVGHEPYLTQLISELCLGGPGLPIQLKKGGLCRLQIEKLAKRNGAILEWLLPPTFS
ncbi:MAG TPA: phosphohistidine phosphatase SixA [Verrucomicrobiae bacterium]|nr:phosphohistidine phosphatase SixA [Verrucomicrobiae bacterium]